MKLPARLELSRRAHALLNILLGLLILLSLAIVFPSPTFAQGSCSCEEWQGPERLICIPVDTCASGYMPSEDSCPTEFAPPYGCKTGATCTCAPGSPAPCTEAGGYCLVSCGPDYDPYPPGDPECVAANRMCCKPADEEPPEELPPACTDECCPTPIGCIPINLTDAGRYLFCIMLDLVGLLALIMFVAGGYQVMAAGDDPKALEEGKSRMSSAILGFLAFLFFGWIIRSILGMEIITLPIVCHI